MTTLSKAQSTLIIMSIFVLAQWLWSKPGFDEIFAPAARQLFNANAAL
jgi:hypothetical protein